MKKTTKTINKTKRFQLGCEVTPRGGELQGYVGYLMAIMMEEMDSKMRATYIVQFDEPLTWGMYSKEQLKVIGDTIYTE